MKKNLGIISAIAFGMICLSPMFANAAINNATNNDTNNFYYVTVAGPYPYQAESVQKVQKFNEDGKRVLEWGSVGSEPGQFYGLDDGSIAIGQQDGTVYVSSIYIGSPVFDGWIIQQFKPEDGSYIRSITRPAWIHGSNIASITVDSNNILFVSESNTWPEPIDQHILKYNQKGNLLDDWDISKKYASLGLTFFGRIANDGKGNLYLTCPAVSRKPTPPGLVALIDSNNGDIKGIINRQNKAHIFAWNDAITVDNDNQAYVIDDTGGNTKIVRFKSGVFDSGFGIQDQSWGSISLCTDSKGNIIGVFSPDNQRNYLKKYSNKGELLWEIKSDEGTRFAHVACGTK